MHQSSSASRGVHALKITLVAGLALAVAGIGPSAVAALGTRRPAEAESTTSPALTTNRGAALARVAARRVHAMTTPKTAKPTVAPIAAVAKPAVHHAVVAPARVFATGNARLDALLATLPAVLFTAGASVHFGFNPLDTCCHAGGYNPGPNDVWVSANALKSTAELTYVTVHELGHSLHLHSALGAALTAAVAGAPSVRPGSPWDVSEKVADCVAWVLYPAQTAAAGITYWSCPEPWRTKVRAALQ
jgi:Zn-dependent protease with chaperone function